MNTQEKGVGVLNANCETMYMEYKLDSKSEVVA